jgi:hypothetical protein
MKGKLVAPRDQHFLLNFHFSCWAEMKTPFQLPGVCARHPAWLGRHAYNNVIVCGGSAGSGLCGHILVAQIFFGISAVSAYFSCSTKTLLLETNTLMGSRRR